MMSLYKDEALNVLPLKIVRNDEYIEDESKLILEQMIEDESELENEIESIRLARVKRYKNIVEDIKNKYGSVCQICGDSFEMKEGKYYVEAHHIIRIADGGTQQEKNVILLCPTHHRMCHYAKMVEYCWNGDEVRAIMINGQYMEVNYKPIA